MRNSTFPIAAFVLAGISSLAYAGPTPVTATLSATYFEVPDGSDPDFNTNSTPNVALGSALGSDGLPVATSPFGVNDIGPGNQITWWSPTLNSNVTETGTGTINLPYSSNMFAPNSTGTNDESFFETAFFKGNFTLSAPGTVTFSLGSDDDSFIYVDGVLIGQNPGVHSVTNVSFTSGELPAGPNSIEVFYDDRQNVAASLSLSLETTGVIITPGTPEPSTWVMMLVGFAGLGFAGYRGSRKSAAGAA
jgi:PEP-CTERM motif